MDIQYTTRPLSLGEMILHKHLLTNDPEAVFNWLVSRMIEPTDEARAWFLNLTWPEGLAEFTKSSEAFVQGVSLQQMTGLAGALEGLIE